MTTAERTTCEVLGYIDPHGLYTTRGAMIHGGLGEEALMQGRKAGVLTPVRKGNFLYYLGSQLIQWILSEEK